MIARCVMVAMAFGCAELPHFASADDWFPMEGSYDEIDACQTATGHCAETEYDVGWGDAVACVDAEYRKDPALKAQCCEYCDALARCAEGRTTFVEYDDDGYYSTRAKNCKESKMCDSDSGFPDVTGFSTETPGQTPGLTTDDFYGFSTDGFSTDDNDIETTMQELKYMLANNLTNEYGYNGMEFTASSIMYSCILDNAECKDEFISCLKSQEFVMKSPYGGIYDLNYESRPMCDCLSSSCERVHDVCTEKSLQPSLALYAQSWDEGYSDAIINVSQALEMWTQDFETSPYSGKCAVFSNHAEYSEQNGQRIANVLCDTRNLIPYTGQFDGVDTDLLELFCCCTSGKATIGITEIPIFHNKDVGIM